MKKLLLTSLVLPLCLLFSGAAKTEDKPQATAPPTGSANQGEMHFQSGPNRLIVSRALVTDEALLKAEIEHNARSQAELTKQMPGATFLQLKPDYIMKYSVYLDTLNGKPRRLLWQRIIPEYLQPYWGQRPERRFLDLHLEGDSLIVLHSLGSGGTRVEFADITKPLDKASARDWYLPMDIKISVALGTQYFQSAVISGSFREKNLKVSAQKIDGDTAIFLWNGNEWQELKAQLKPRPAPLPFPTKPVFQARE